MCKENVSSGSKNRWWWWFWVEVRVGARVWLCCAALDFSTIIYPSSKGKSSYSIRIRGIWKRRAEIELSQFGGRRVGVALGMATSPRQLSWASNGRSFFKFIIIFLISPLPSCGSAYSASSPGRLNSCSNESWDLETTQAKKIEWITMSSLSARPNSFSIKTTLRNVKLVEKEGEKERERGRERELDWLDW